MQEIKDQFRSEIAQVRVSRFALYIPTENFVEYLFSIPWSLLKVTLHVHHSSCDIVPTIL